jgi:methanogenic corrinoid protein MtbC1
MDTKRLSGKIENNLDELTDKTIECIKEGKSSPDFSFNVAKSVRDLEYILNYLAETVYFDNDGLFKDFSIWLSSHFENLDLSDDVFINTYKCIQRVIKDNFEPEEINYLNNIIDSSIKKALNEKNREDSYLTEDNPHKDFAEKYLNLLLDNKKSEASNLIVNEAISKMSVPEIYLDILEPVQKEVGRLWHANEISVAQEHYISSVTQLVMSQLYFHFLSSGGEKGNIVTTAVGTELHEIGIRMVADLLEIDGFDTIHLGANTPPSSIIETLKKNRTVLVGISVTLPIHLKELVRLVDMIRSEPELANLKILVGGYALNQNPELKEELDVDRYSMNAKDAVQKANKLIEVG